MGWRGPFTPSVALWHKNKQPALKGIQPLVSKCFKMGFCEAKECDRIHWSVQGKFVEMFVRQRVREAFVRIIWRGPSWRLRRWRGAAGQPPPPETGCRAWARRLRSLGWQARPGSGMLGPRSRASTPLRRFHAGASHLKQHKTFVNKQAFFLQNRKTQFRFLGNSVPKNGQKTQFLAENSVQNGQKTQFSPPKLSFFAQNSVQNRKNSVFQKFQKRG